MQQSALSGTHPIRYTEYKNGVREEVAAGVIEEGLTCLSVNGQELATLMCSPIQLDDLALGFLRAEGFITDIDEVRHVHISKSNCVEVWLNKTFEKPTRSITTAGCGGGITFDDLSQRHAPLASALTLKPEQVCGLMRQLMLSATIYNHVRGIHTSALSDSNRLVYLAEDVGRHNTIDRLWGKALRDGYNPAQHVLLTSGRISSEMLSKAMKMGAPIVISRTSPTSLSIALAQAWGLTLIGYCRGKDFRVYAGAERIEG